MFEINISINTKEISKKLNALAYKELPYATARALTELAREVQRAEQVAMQGVFDKPKPFTVNSVRVFGATKDTQTAGVFTMDKAANYLSPFEDNGPHFLNPGQTLLTGPVQAKKTEYGGLPRGYTRRMKERGDVFVGVVNTAQGRINGLWQRTVRYETVDRSGTRHLANNLVGRRLRDGHRLTGHKVRSLRLLVRYVNNKPVKQHLEFIARAAQLVERRLDAVFGREMAIAIARSKLG